MTSETPRYCYRCINHQECQLLNRYQTFMQESLTNEAQQNTALGLNIGDAAKRNIEAKKKSILRERSLYAAEAKGKANLRGCPFEEEFTGEAPK